ncbi:DRTGG domain-containing protein [Leptolyngbya sp. FACHB-711]|uniref:DRTGG domain-containing protein n=1 Tax=unclassified Leptolyngbya TaxID=2650499 RepID=UPI00168874B8|nr:phosphotransacetylase family protein [Cyanobacteria bacterium FACHB-502]MBD2025056.1 phosphotransacetylase family protein [Leptolyngbya sp. FACHB-711]
MPKSANFLLIGSSEAYSGKSAMILGMAHQLQQKGLKIAYGKPIGTCLTEDSPDQPIEEDVKFMAQTLKLPDGCVLPMLLPLDEATIFRRINGTDSTHYQQLLQRYAAPAGVDLVLLEGAGTLEEGKLFDLSVPQIAQALDSPVMLVSRFRSALVVDSLLAAKARLGDRLMGVLINDIPHDQVAIVESQIQPFLQRHGIEVLGLLPRNDLLRSVSVAELVHQLGAEVLCRPDRLDLMVESLKIGAMNVNSALEYFRKGRNMAVVTGGDRTDIQLAALETSTQCLILTGHLPPSRAILSRAEDLEIPILSVDLDTLTTVEIVDRTFGQVRLHEPIKVQAIQQMMTKHFKVDRLLTKLGLDPVATV